MKKVLGFTLCEVLITIGIIGIVAEMTIPLLVRNYNKLYYLSQLKKTYSVINEFLVNYARDMGCPGDLKCSGLFATGANQVNRCSQITSYFKVIKDCSNSADSGCFPGASFARFDAVGTISPSQQQYLTSEQCSFITSDGIAYYFVSNWGCTADCGTHGLEGSCGNVYVDLNGPTRRPNAWGADIFAFRITNAQGIKVFPLCSRYDNQGCAWTTYTDYCTSSNPVGVSCTARIIEQANWQINYY